MAFNRLNHSILGEIRPRFVLQIDCDTEKAVEQLKAKVKLDPTVTTLRANHTKNYVFLNIPLANQHYWSPEMCVRIEHEEFMEFPRVYCMLGPRQQVWAMFTLIYAVLGLATLFGGVFGLVQYKTMGSSPFLWVFPLCLIAFLSVFATAKAGQHKGRDQMLHLVSFLYHSLDEIADVKRVEA